MIIVNGIEIKQEQFGDGTLKCEAVHGDEIIANGNVIWWLYDNDAELFTLYCVVRDLQSRMPTASSYLFMPYIPHARQDRNVSGRLFTLKYFSEIINTLNFYYVAVLDPHSEASSCLIDRMVYLPFENQLDYIEGYDCSYGGTFVAAAKALRERGVEKIMLMVSHCENNILKGEVFDYIDKVVTTDTICTIEHPKLEFAARYRTDEGEREDV